MNVDAPAASMCVCVCADSQATSVSLDVKEKQVKGVAVSHFLSLVVFSYSKILVNIMYAMLPQKYDDIAVLT